MPKINVMPKYLAELIAAGEVVERPASVVKELVENSIDAGASTITLEIMNGGISYIRISDNGCGIDRNDVPKAFISHATSKITTPDDLNSIMTLGFRGEALPSIAAVSRVEVLTRTADEELGTRYVIEYGEEQLTDDAGCPAGTTITVRDIFQKTPARMKFLKKDVTEANAVAAVIDRIAVSHPDISFRFIREGKQVLMTSGNGDFLTCIREVFGKETASQLIFCENESNGVKVSGYISKPEYSRPNRNMQYFFLNGRYVKTGTGSAAVAEAYRGSIMVGKFPSCFLNISINPNHVDVNVHPAKIEIRFSDEKPVFNAVYGACRTSLEKGDSPKQVKIADRNSTPFRQQNTYTPAEQIKLKENKESFWQHISVTETDTVKHDKPAEKKNIDIPFDDSFVSAEPVKETAVEPKVPETSGSESVKPDNTDTGNESFVEMLLNMKTENQSSLTQKNDAPPVPEVMDINDFEEEQFKLVGEAFMTYIICEYKNKLVIIDKHAAHERIIYERLKSENNERTGQILLAPVTVNLTKDEYSAVLDNIELINDSGFLVEDFGSGTVIVSECPMEITADDVADVITEIAGRFVEKKQDVMFEKIDWIFHSVACRSAIKAGNFTSRLEMEHFAKELLQMPNIRYCPHGRPVIVEMSQRELEKNFGRIQ